MMTYRAGDTFKTHGSGGNGGREGRAINDVAALITAAELDGEGEIVFLLVPYAHEKWEYLKGY